MDSYFTQPNSEWPQFIKWYVGEYKNCTVLLRAYGRTQKMLMFSNHSYALVIYYKTTKSYDL